MNTHTRTSRSGFTITELIVVISIAILLIGTLAPALSTLRNATQTQVAINTVSVAVTASRAYVKSSDTSDLDRLAIENPGYAGLRYSGTAILFTPAGELRLVQNDQLARNWNDSEYLQTPTLGPRRNGYDDVPRRDYIKLPRDAGVVGIARNGTSPRGGLLLLTPPFAVRFDPHGSLIQGQPSNSERVVYYDSNYNDKYVTTTSKRTAGYNPDAWDPNSPDYINTNWNDTANLHELPFEEIETVVGVVIYSKRELRESGNSHAASSGTGKPINDNALDWILDDDNGTVLFFSRYSGAVIKQPKS